MTGPVEKDVDDDFRAKVRAGGLQDSPPEIAAEFVRVIREIREVFERHGITSPDDAPIEIQRAIFKEVKKLVRKPGPKAPELTPGQFERDLILWVEAHNARGKPGGVESAISKIAARWGVNNGTLRNRYYKLDREFRDARPKAAAEAEAEAEDCH